MTSNKPETQNDINHTAALVAAVDISTLSPELKDTLSAFERDCATYRERQAWLTAAVTERDRLCGAAKALDAEAASANTQWKTLAKESTVDQRKVNATIEREVALKQQADTLHRTAAVRDEMILQANTELAGLRLAITKQAHILNSRYRSERLAALVADERFGDTVQTVFALCQQQAEQEHLDLNNGRKDLTEAGARESEEIAWHTFRGLLRGLLAKRQPGSTLVMVEIPPLAAGEAVVKNHFELQRLVAATKGQ